ncbi:MAG: NapC/NirT family cytochrome c, partial [Planctomycetota bacterium]
MRNIRAIFVSWIGVWWQLNWPARILLVTVIIAACSVIAIEVTAQPGFCNSCHIMNTYYDSWRNSGHSEVNCLDCHLQPGFAGYVRGKINGFAQAVD